MFNNASNIDVSHSTFSEVHRDQYVYSGTHVGGNQTVNTIVHGNQVFQTSAGLENLHRASVPGATFDSFDRHPAPTCLPGTRLELLARIVEWIDDQNCDQRVCWLSGLAGSGKSAVAQSIAEKYASQHRLVASFFFSRKEILRRKAQRFFPTLASQMLAFVPSIRPALLGALDADPMVPTKVLLEQARRLLQEPLALSTESFPHSVLIVVDSLDECDDTKMASEIVRLLVGILRRCRWPLKILFTSRAEAHIVQTFQHPELCDMTYSLHLQDFGADNDIRTYLYHSFKRIRESLDVESISNYALPWPSEGEIEMIVQKAAGLFIFATTVVKYVDTDYDSPVTQLQAVLWALRGGTSIENTLIHSPLDVLYLDALRKIPGVDKARLVLGSIVFAFQPLSIRGLNDLLSKFQFDVPLVVKGLCSVLVSSSDVEHQGAIRIYHTSFRDFLTSSHRSQQYFVDPDIFHSVFSHACLQLMNQHLRVDMCNFGNPSLLNCEVEDLDKRCKLGIPEGVRYACRWFAHHLSQVPWDRGIDSALALSLQNFANQYLLNWIEVLSLTGELDSAIFSLREAADWLKRSPKPDEGVLSLFCDAERLVLLCYDSIQQAALQVYYSLPCVPVRAQIRATYANELKKMFVITRGLDDDWKLCIRSALAGATVKSLAISVSGRLIASAGETTGVKLWDTLTGRNTGHFHGNGNPACPVIFSPSGDYVAIGYNTGAIDIWDVTTGQRPLDLDHGSHGASVTALTFSQNSRFVASGAADASVHVWDISAPCLKHSFTYQKGPVTCLLFSFDSNLIASGSDDTSVATSAVESGRMARKFQGHSSRVNCISFSPDDGWIASCSDDQSVRLWDTRTGVCLRTFAGAHKKPIRQVWITADGKHVVSVCNMDIYMWDTSSPNRKSPQHIWSVNHYYRKLAMVFPAWYAKIAKLFPAAVVGRLAGADDGTVLHAVPSPDGKGIGCAYGSSVLFLELPARQRSWSKVLGSPTASDEPPLFVDNSDDMSTAIAMTPDGNVLVTSDGDHGAIKMWNTSPRNGWKMYQNLGRMTVDGFWPAPDGRSLLVKLLVGLQLVLPSGAVIKDLETGGDTLGQVGAVPSPDSRYFAFWAEYTWNVDNSFSIHIYDASTGARLKRIPGFFNINCGQFSARSDLFACAHGDGVVQIWELPSALCKTTITTGHAAITALEFLPGSVTLVVGSDQGCVEVRLVEGGDIVYRVRCAPSKVLALAVPDSALVVAVGHEDGSVFVWDPSYVDVAPHCLSPKCFKKTSEDGADEPDGVDFIKFTEGYRSVCSRSTSGVICAWDLTRCLAEYAKRAPESLVGNAVAEVAAAGAHVPDSSADGSIGLAARDILQDAMADPTDEAPPAGLTTLVPQGGTSEPGSATLPGRTDTPLTSSPSPSCPHLVSRSDAHIVYDRYFRSTYSVDNREGWVYRGSRRLFWLPNSLRPAEPTTLSAFEHVLVIVTRSRPIVFFDLRPMADLTPMMPSREQANRN